VHLRSWTTGRCTAVLVFVPRPLAPPLLRARKPQQQAAGFRGFHGRRPHPRTHDDSMTYFAASTATVGTAPLLALPATCSGSRLLLPLCRLAALAILRHSETFRSQLCMQPERRLHWLRWLPGLRLLEANGRGARGRRRRRRLAAVCSRCGGLSVLFHTHLCIPLSKQAQYLLEAAECGAWGQRRRCRLAAVCSRRGLILVAQQMVLNIDCAWRAAGALVTHHT